MHVRLGQLGVRNQRRRHRARLLRLPLQGIRRRERDGPRHLHGQLDVGPWSRSLDRRGSPSRAPCWAFSRIASRSAGHCWRLHRARVALHRRWRSSHPGRPCRGCGSSRPTRSRTSASPAASSSTTRSCHTSGPRHPWTRSAAAASPTATWAAVSCSWCTSRSCSPRGTATPPTSPPALALASVGVWWLGWATWTLRVVPEPPVVRSSQRMTATSAAAIGIRELGQTLRELTRFRVVLVFLAAYVLFNDGVQTVLAIAGAYAADTLGIPLAFNMGHDRDHPIRCGARVARLRLARGPHLDEARAHRLARRLGGDRPARRLAGAAPAERPRRLRHQARLPGGIRRLPGRVGTGPRRSP